MEIFLSDMIYVLKPSKIVDLKSSFVLNKRGEKRLFQTATFERTSQPVLALFSEKDNKFLDVFSSDIKISERFYSALVLEQSGIHKAQEKCNFVDIFDGDTTNIIDFVCALGIDKNDLLTRSLYFKYPLNPENMELADFTHKRLLRNKPFYTIKEIEKLNSQLSDIKVPKKLVMRSYITPCNFNINKIV